MCKVMQLLPYFCAHNPQVMHCTSIFTRKHRCGLYSSADYTGNIVQIY